MPKPSGERKSALLVCPEAPFPAVGGGALRTASLATYLRANYALDLILFHEPGAPDPAAALPRGLARDVLTIELPAHRKDALSKAMRNLDRLWRFIPPHEDRFGGFEGQMTAWLGERRYDFGCLEHFWTSPYAGLLRPRVRRLACDLHNIESVFYETRAQTEGAPMAWVWRRFAAANRQRERERLSAFDVLLVTSEADARRVGLPSTVVYPNAIPWHDPPAVAKQRTIAFSGNLEFPPNIEAVRWFAREVWPRLAERFPELEWRLIGKGPQFVAGLVEGLPRVRLTGPVEDAVRELAAAQVAVVPIRSGSGTRLKILEAWAAGTVVISTDLGAEGLDAGGGLRRANTAEEFVDGVAQLLTSENERDRIAMNGRELYEKHYTWAAAWISLESNRI